jgi:hypothetical protein
MMLFEKSGSAAGDYMLGRNFIIDLTHKVSQEKKHGWELR